jgi:microcystin-dependent protein
VFTATDANEANELTSTYAAQGGIVYQGASTFTQLDIGTAGQVMKVNSGATAPEWGQVASAGIADTAITLGKLAAAVANALVPVGSINAYGGATAPTGWLLCDGTTFNASTYPSLNTVLGGNTLPNFAGRVPMGKTGSGTGSTLLGTGGSNTIGETNLPVHQHTMNHTHGSFTSSGQSQSHNHTVSLNDPGHTHTINGNEASISTPGVVMYVLGYLGGNSYTEQTDLKYTGITVSSVGNASQDHTHNVNVTAHTGNTGTAGSGTAYFQPFVSVNYIIKHD